MFEDVVLSPAPLFDMSEPRLDQLQQSVIKLVRIVDAEGRQELPAEAPPDHGTNLRHAFGLHQPVETGGERAAQ